MPTPKPAPMPCRRSIVVLTPEDKERFHRFAQTGPEDTCWEWQGRIGTNGYGILNIGGFKFLAHRLALWIRDGTPVPEGKAVCHKCDNRKCFNPSHLFIGTIADNNLDCERKGRNPHPAKPRPVKRLTHPHYSRPGEQNPKAKLSADDVRMIRRLYRRGDSRMLAAQFQVSKNAILRIVNRDAWASL